MCSVIGALLGAQEQEFVRPGFELGYKQDDKYYIYNHLVFNILVYQTHGEYTAASKAYKNYAAGDLNKRRVLSLSGSHSTTSRRGLRGSSDFVARLLGSEAKAAAPAADAAPAAEPGSPDAGPYYMVVGFEVSPCSIAREAGQYTRVTSTQAGAHASYLSPVITVIHVHMHRFYAGCHNYFHCMC